MSTNKWIKAYARHIQRKHQSSSNTTTQLATWTFFRQKEASITFLGWTTTISLRRTRQMTAKTNHLVFINHQHNILEEADSSFIYFTMNHIDDCKCIAAWWNFLPIKSCLLIWSDFWCFVGAVCICFWCLISTKTSFQCCVYDWSFCIWHFGGNIIRRRSVR